MLIVSLVSLLSFLGPFAHASIPAKQLRPELYGSSLGMKCPVEVVPERSLGPIRIGMSRSELKSLGLPVREVSGLDHSLIVGAYSVRLDDEDRVVRVGADLGDLPKCVFVESKKLSPAASPAELSGYFSKCGPEERNEGGNLIKCAGVVIGSGSWGGGQKTAALIVE